MTFSLPSYRRFAEASIKRLREDAGRESSDRFNAMLFNVLILSGLWGVPLYARWFVLSNTNHSNNVSEDIVGKWRTTDGSHFQLTFNRDGRFLLSWKNNIVETADYWFYKGNPNEVVMSDFCQQPGNRAFRNEMCWFHVSEEGGRLFTEFSFTLDELWRKTASRHKDIQIEGEHLKLYPAVFERVE